jgi:hypothetical protein
MRISIFLLLFIAACQPTIVEPEKVDCSFSQFDTFTGSPVSHAFQPAQSGQVVWGQLGMEYFGTVFQLNSTCDYAGQVQEDCITDWNKLTGFTMAPITNSHRNTYFVGWRHLSEGHQVTPYLHDDNEAGAWGDFPGSDWEDFPVYTLPDPYDCYIVIQGLDASKNEVYFGVFAPINPDDLQFEPLFEWSKKMPNHFPIKRSKTARRTSTWFGGNCKPPHEMTMNRKHLSSKVCKQIINNAY